MRLSRSLVIAACCLSLSTLKGFAAAPPAPVIPVKPGPLGADKSLQIQFKLAQPRNFALSIRFKDATFAGATILPKLNGQTLLPYHAFGGDTRYDNVRGKPGMHPPVAKIEANYVLPARWLKAGNNSLTIANAGPGIAVVEAVTLREVAGHNLPRYENSIYFDFDVWRQGRAPRAGTNPFLDSMLLGTIPGGGVMTLNYTGGDALPLKLRAEEARAGWDYKNIEFYSIWHLRNTAKQWAKYIDVDNNKETTALFHHQFSLPAAMPPGADVVLMDPEKLLGVLKPGINGLAPYTTIYNITCEQEGLAAQGFGEWGEKWAKEGYDAKVWADNYQDTYNTLGKYIHEKSPGAPILSTHWWQSDVRNFLFDTSLQRGYRMADMADGLMTHFYSFAFHDFDKDGKITEQEVFPERQYPGGRFEAPNQMKSRRYMGQWILAPEIAIDYNRYRMNRTEKDLLPSVRKQDSKAGYWNNGKPIRYTAGFDGDERIYTNETAFYDRNNSGPASYQFLHSMFSYSLLPMGATEPRDFKVTRTLPLEWTNFTLYDIFSEVEVPINRYGDWETGAAHTQRLRTRDPLYGDMFGYTGFEYFNTGDFIWLNGIEERHHRREPYNALNLVRRTCYAFVTGGDVYPATVNDPDTNQLFVKSLAIKQNYQDIIGVYAVNYDDKPHTLDITLPVGWQAPATAQVFDEKAAVWADAKEIKLTPQNGGIRYKVTVPAKAPWAVFIYPPAGRTLDVLGGPPTPQPLGPWGEANQTGEVTLRWNATTQDAIYDVQLAREMLFRPEDMVLTRNVIRGYLPITVPLTANLRYHWRVRAMDAKGNSSPWSRPHSFWYQATKPGKQPTGDVPPLENTPPRETLPKLSPFTDSGNLAHTGHPFAFANYWEGAGDAVDGYPETAWLSTNLTRQPVLPAWWAVRFDKDETVKSLSVLWADKAIVKDFDVQAFDGKDWSTIRAVRGNTERQSTIELDAATQTRAIRILITAAVEKNVGIAEVYIR